MFSLRLSLIALSCLSLLCLAPLCAWADSKTLNFNCTIHSPYEEFFTRLAEKACAENGVRVRWSTPPVGRSLLNVNEGIDDGDGPRVAGLSADYPNLVMVPEPIGEFVFGAFATNNDIVIKDWDSLENYNVSYVIGWKIFDTNVKKAKSITKVRDKVILFNLLAAKRTDLVLITKLAGYATIAKLQLEGITFLESPLAVKPNYLYLNKRHEDLAKALAITIAKYKKDGTYDLMYREIVTSVLDGNR